MLHFMDTRIDFYVLQQHADVVRQHFACRLAEKALIEHHHIVIALDSEEQALTLSDYLWTFKPESFLPHQLHNTQMQSAQISKALVPAPIVLTWDAMPKQGEDVLINLRQEVPQGFDQFKRVIEIVIQETSCLRATRAHFQAYRTQGYTVNSHHIRQ